MQLHFFCGYNNCQWNARREKTDIDSLIVLEEGTGELFAAAMKIHLLELI
jgi:hypothetical protein